MLSLLALLGPLPSNKYGSEPPEGEFQKMRVYRCSVLSGLHRPVVGTILLIINTEHAFTLFALPFRPHSPRYTNLQLLATSPFAFTSVICHSSVLSSHSVRHTLHIHLIIHICGPSIFCGTASIVTCLSLASYSKPPFVLIAQPDD